MRAALVYNRRRSGAKMDRVIASLKRKLARESDDNLRRAMHFPARWDPFFKDYMILADVYWFAGQALLLPRTPAPPSTPPLIDAQIRFECQKLPRPQAVNLQFVSSRIYSPVTVR